MPDPAPAAVPPFPEVTVLLGDPSLPDGTKFEGRYHKEDLDCIERMKAALESLPGYRFDFVTEHEGLLQRFLARPPQFVLNFCDTGYRNNAFLELNLPAFLEMLGVPYSGAGPFSMVLAYDKAIVREVATARGVPVPDELYVEPGDSAAAERVTYPALIKPNYGDGSVGITKDAVVADAAGARRYLDWLWQALPGRAALIQEYLPGPEYGMGVIGNPRGDFTVLPMLEVDFSALAPALPPILGFESKTQPDSPYWTDIRFRETRLDKATRERLAGYARRLFGRLQLRDYGRFDFRADAKGTIKLMEVNPNPAWAWDGKLAIMADKAGIAYPRMLAMILDAAQQRCARERSSAAP
jgi:D-alanine-D-alanine ligase